MNIILLLFHMTRKVLFFFSSAVPKASVPLTRNSRQEVHCCYAAVGGGGRIFCDTDIAFERKGGMSQTPPTSKTSLLRPSLAVKLFTILAQVIRVVLSSRGAFFFLGGGGNPSLIVSISQCYALNKLKGDLCVWERNCTFWNE